MYRMLVVLGVFVISFFTVAGLGGCEKSSPTASNPDEVRLTVKNGLIAFNIRHVYIASPGTNQWGNDLLGGRNITPGKSVNFMVKKGTYDLRVVDSDNDAYLKRNVNMNKNFTWEVDLFDLFEGLFDDL